MDAFMFISVMLYGEDASFQHFVRSLTPLLLSAHVLLPFL